MVRHIVLLKKLLKFFKKLFLLFTQKNVLVCFQFPFGGFNMFPDISRPFNNSYKCYSVSMFPGNDRQDVEKGGKSKLFFTQNESQWKHRRS